MATQERLHKSLDALKTLSTNQPSLQNRKKEKIHHCYVVSEAFTNPTIKVSTNFPVLLGITIETFLKLCDDADADIRMTSDECLNRIIRAVIDGHIGKIQIELHKEIKKNGPARSLRAALVRFSQLAHHIRPHKGKPYVVNLFPSIIKIADRTEEAIHETLATCLPKILKSLGIFAPDNDVKAILKAFLQNITRPSAAIRRTSSSCILSICMHSRRPYVFVTYCINYLLDILLPVDSNQSSPSVLGVLHCLKMILPAIKELGVVSESTRSFKDIDIVQPVAPNKLIQVYELCLYYLTNKDHNIVNASLDTLHVLFLNATSELQEKLMNPTGIDRSRIHKSLSINNVRSPSQLSVATTATTDENLEYELTETIESDIVKWIGESKLSMMNEPHSKNDVTEPLATQDEKEPLQYYDNTQRLPESFNVRQKSSSIIDDLDKLSDKSEDSIVESVSEDKTLNDADSSGLLEIDIGDYLDKSVPLLYCARLIAKLFLLRGIPNKYINDKTVRVSVKSSALVCLSSIFRLYPEAFFSYLDKNYTPLCEGSSRLSSQKLDDIMLLAVHSDPQLRGIVRCVISDVVVTILYKTKLSLNKQELPVKIEYFVDIWIKGLIDENSNCLRQTLLSLKTVLNLLSESEYCYAILPILNVLPTLANNPYWLVKVALCELVSNISYITIFHITGDSFFQRKILCYVLFELLGDADQRVRSAASAALTEIMDYLYFDDFNPKENCITTKGIYYVQKYLSCLCDEKPEKSLYWTHFVENMPAPYCEILAVGSDRIEYFLLEIIMKLYTKILETTSKHFIYGCVETLSSLSNRYPCTVYQRSWCIACGTISSDNTRDLLGLCVSLLTTSTHVYDIPFLSNLMNLTSNLYAGYAMTLVRPMDVLEKSQKNWSMYSKESLKSLSDQYLSYIMKLLNIFHHVINDIVPTPSNKSVLPHLTSTTGTLSPKRRRSEDKRPLGSVRIIVDKDEKIEKKDIKYAGLGYFAGSQHYMRLFETLRSAFVNYRISLDPGASENFIELMRKAMASLCVIMEIGTLTEFGRISEEILNYLKSTFPLDRTSTVQCVQQLLKCLFGTNLTANLGDIIDDKTQHDMEEKYSFYNKIFQTPYKPISSYLQRLGTISKVECDGDSTLMGYLHRKDVKNPTTISRTSDETLVNYIRIFEPMVISSLKQYTVTSDVIFQCHVLKLLSQLVQLRVNYCLLDSDQVFKDFVLKQFEYVEEGLVPNSEKLIPRIFQFLVHLSYSKQHSKSIMDIPKIIQLCDGLMASGQDPRTHCIPALEPIVEDVFLIRSRSNTTDMKELETTREVVLSMLLRLLEHKEVIDLVTLVLEDSKYCTDDTDKWLRWSGQVASVFLQMLRQDKIRINNLESFLSLKKFVFALNPNVFRPVDDVIIMLFQDPPTLSKDRTQRNITRWLSKIIILFFIVSPLKEDTLVSKVHSLKAQFRPGSIFENFTGTADPLNVHSSADMFLNISGEVLLARLIIRIVSIVSTELCECESVANQFLVSQFSTFLIYCSHIFQSGSLCRVSQVAASLLSESPQSDVDTVHKKILQVRSMYPIIAFQWCHILSVLNFNSLAFWNTVIGSEDYPINNCLVRTGATIVFCDYLNENFSETMQLSWILTKHSEKLVSLVDEDPVSEFLSFVHRNPALSEQLISSISEISLIDVEPVFKTKILKCVENCHVSQTGAVIRLLLPRMLSGRQIAISRSVASLASRKIEFMFTLSAEEVLTQLSKDEVFVIKNQLNQRNMAKRHETLINLLNKLLVQYYDMSPMEFGKPRIVNPEYIRKLDINKKWLLAQIRGKYEDETLRKETAQIMETLDYNDLVSFHSSLDNHLVFFGDCIESGVKILKERSLKEEPPILKTTVDSILKTVSHIVNVQCENHEVFSLRIDGNNYKILSAIEESVDKSIKVGRYTSDMKALFEDASVSTLLQNVCLSLSKLMKYLSQLPTLQLSEIDCENVSKFAVISMEYVNFMVHTDKIYLNVHYLETFLNCANEILKQSQFCSYLNVDANISYLCSATNALLSLVEFLSTDDNLLPFPAGYLSKCISDEHEVCQAQLSCENLYTLTCWLYTIQNKHVNIPAFLLYKIRSLIVALSRLPLVNSYSLVPCKVWKIGWQPEFHGKFLTQCPPLPVDMLQEIDVLEEYVFRITLLGWTTRQQFEETWMCFLSVLCTPLDNLEMADISLARRASSLAIKAITALLLQTSRYPVLGYKNVSSIIHVSRNAPIPLTSTSTQKLKIIQDHIESKYNEVCDDCLVEKIKNVFSSNNLEKVTDQYSYGQVSVRYLLAATSGADENNTTSCADRMYRKRMALLEESGLDVNSCLQFLLDYYTQLMRSDSAVTDIRILHETIRSTLYISDLFTEKTQFSWMLEIFLDLLKVHAVEDELLHQYLVVGVCKAVGVLTPDLEVYEQTKKLLVQFLKSPFLPTRIACLYGLLYILEGCVLSNIAIGGISEELQLILPCAVEYVRNHLSVNNPALIRSQEHTMVVWSLAFYLIENVDNVHMESNFVSSTLQAAVSSLQKKSLNYVDRCIIKGLERLLLMKPVYILDKIGKNLQKLALQKIRDEHPSVSILGVLLKGLERLLLMKPVYILDKIGKNLQKLALQKIRDEHPSVSILGVQLLATFMYVDCWEHLEKPGAENEQSSPDHLVQTIEKISAIFDRIKKSYVSEVEILCSVLPLILRDFFSPSDILTKVIGEFLSPQQPHPKLMSGVVFQVFESAIQMNQLSLLQDWVVFSLSNFTQSFSNMAIWSLTCFFIGASPNQWLRSCFPYVQSRLGRYEYEDRKIFCIAGSDFYKNLTNDNQRKTFVDNFVKVKDHTDMPFSDLLNSL